MGTVIIVIILILLGFVSTYLNSPKVKGKQGEQAVARVLKKLDPEEYVVLNDVLIPNSEGTAQIDHIVLSPYVTAVIETKNYKGWIYGNETDRNWTQVIYKRKERFYNPVRQNKTHIRALGQLLQECEDLNLQSIIVFNDRATFKEVRTQTPVIHPRELLGMIRSYTVRTVSADSLTKAREIISDANIVDKQVRDEHVKRARHRTAKGYRGNRS